MALPPVKLPQVVDHLRAQQLVLIVAVDDVALVGVFLPVADAVEPFGVAQRLDTGQQLIEHRPHVADNPDIDFHVLVDLRRIDLDVDFLGVGGIGLQIARHAVIKAHPQRDQQVGFLNGIIRGRFAVHPHHPNRQRVIFRHRTFAEQRQRHRDLRPFRQFAQLLRRARHDDAVPRQDNRALRLMDQLERCLNVAFVWLLSAGDSPAAESRLRDRRTRSSRSERLWECRSARDRDAHCGRCRTPRA